MIASYLIADKRQNSAYSAPHIFFRAIQGFARNFRTAEYLRVLIPPQL